MSSLQVLTPAAVGRHFDFGDGVAQAAVVGQEAAAGPGKKLPQTTKLAGVVAAARLEVRTAREMISSGIAEIDSLSGGLPRGCLTEICGPASSGRTSLLLAAMGAATQREEVCALVDVSDALDPRSAAAAGVDLKKILWVRCGTRNPASSVRSPASGVRRPASSAGLSEEHREEFLALENALRVTDLLLQSGGFGMVVIDVGDVSARAARRVPLTSWFRFRRAVENTNTVLLVSSRQSCAQTCASLVLELQATGARLPAPGIGLPVKSAAPAHAQILEGLSIEAELLRSRVERKPARSANVGFEIKTAWGG